MSDRAVYPHRSHPGLRAARARRELSQDELAFLTGVPQSRLSRAERGYLWLHKVEREKVARALGVTMADLDGGGDTRDTASSNATQRGL